MERLQRVIASRGVSSRRSAEQLIAEGRVSVNGTVVTELGTRVNPTSDEIRVDGKVLRPQRLRTVILNKPAGYITTMQDERDRRTVMELVPTRERLFPVGRLDRDTEGLLLLTNDGELANRIMHPRYRLAKEYHVLTDRRPTDRIVQRIRDGLTVDGRTIVPDEVRLLRETREGITIRIDIHEGFYHAVRRLMEIAGIPVVRLRRHRIGPISVQGIEPGTFRDLSVGELGQLAEAVHLDREDEPALEARRKQPRKMTRPAPRPEGLPGGRRADHVPARTPRRGAPSPASSRQQQPVNRTPARSDRPAASTREGSGTDGVRTVGGRDVGPVQREYRGQGNDRRSAGGQRPKTRSGQESRTGQTGATGDKRPDFGRGTGIETIGRRKAHQRDTGDGTRKRRASPHSHPHRGKKPTLVKRRTRDQ